MAHAQKPDFVFRRKGRVHLNRQGSQFSRLLTSEVCASAVIMLDTSCSEEVWRVLATYSIRQFPLHFPLVRHRVPSHFNWTLIFCEARGSGTALQIGMLRVRFPMVSLEFFIDIILPAARWSWGWLGLYEKRVPGTFPGSKGGRCVGLTTLPPSRADCLEIWESQTPETLRACPGL
jgi:hypothetical protein